MGRQLVHVRQQMIPPFLRVRLNNQQETILMWNVPLCNLAWGSRGGRQVTLLGELRDSRLLLKKIKASKSRYKASLEETKVRWDYRLAPVVSGLQTR